MSISAPTHVDLNTEAPRLPRTATLALAGIVGPIGFTTLVIVQGLLLPDYSHMRMPISALTAWPTGWVQILNFCVSGALTTAFAVALHSAVRSTPRGRTGSALMVMGGIGVVLAGVFPWRMVNGVPTETAPHVVAAVMSFASTGLGLIVFSRRMRADARWRDLATYTMCSGIAVVLLFVTVGFFAIEDGAPLHPWAGGLQRVLCTVWFCWMIVVALRLRALERE
jgi:hypothetical membrane protein